MQPLFSIITVTYNAEKWIERTLLSVLSQTYPNIEYIVIDGASKDGTMEIAGRYASGITCLKSEPDKGIYDAMNKGIQQATGDYIWFLNAGDTLHNADTVYRIVQRIEKRGILPDVIYGETSIVDAEGRNMGLRRLKAPNRLTWKSFRMGMLVCHQSFIAKREIAPLFDLNYRLVADYDWCIQCLKRADSIHNSRRVLSDFLEQGMSSVHRKDSLKERYAIMCKYYGKVPTLLLHGWFAVRFYFAKWVKGRV